MVQDVQCELISWSETERLSQKLARMLKTSGYQPDIVVAIGRGGYVPARLICDYLDMMDLTSIKIELYGAGSDKHDKAIIKYPLCHDIKAKNVLLVDDVNDSGETLELAVNHLQSFAPKSIKIAVIHQKTTSHYPIDFYAKKITKWRWLIYPWAVYEDISGFLRKQPEVIANLEQAQQYLKNTYNIRISKQRLQAVIELMHAAAK